ncbi:hypothetical protein CEP51_003258 [Fusarium floridanum]|uniref:Uncharacterized protein n=1 Tax=Fusarium floridanum TaxID=1325733 RepID=A0A428S6U9_9HYPO|nr:hypothetical protein CEP51_003258 [Fusarium floridanum]
MAQAQEPMDGPLGHCVSRRCRLCRFPIEMGEMVIADVNGWLSPAYAYKESARYYEDKHMLLQGCRADCDHEEGEEGQVPCFHVECRKYASWPDDQGLIRTTEYTYEPTTREDERRVNRTRLLLGKRLQQVLTQLPAEVCFVIAGEFVREFAAMATEQLWQNRPRELEPSDIHNRIDMHVRARYVYIDGIRYVESLSSSPWAQGELVVDPATSSNIDAIHLLEDHIGVRQILFSSTEHSQKLESLLSTPVRGAWWRSIPFSTTVFYASFDGVKLRGIKVDERGPRPVPSAAMQEKSTFKDVVWSRPMYPAHEPELRYWDLNSWEIEEEARNEMVPTWNPWTRFRFRIASFDCNDPAVTGYSVCFMSGIRGIYAHREGEELTMYGDVDMYTRKGVWMHMPIDSNERITAIWVRCADNTSHSGLMFQTNKGRQVMFGYRVDGENRLDEEHLWTALPGVSASPFRLYSKLSYRGVDQIAIQPSETLAEDPTPQMKPWPELASSTPRWHQYSALSLKNVARITPCRRKVHFRTGTFWVITGIMVQYANGRRACAGEFRMDCVGESMWVDHTSSLELGFSVGKDNEAGVWLAKVDTTRSDDEPVIWKSVRWEGMLQWWLHGDGCCEIYHLDGAGHLFQVQLDGIERG